MPLNLPTQKSAIVVAHPDDEILWFSSILDHVETIIICFLSVASQPQWTAGRLKSKAEYPLENVMWLELSQSESFNAADWQNPVATSYGLEVSDTRYKQNYPILKKRLLEHLNGVKTVYTHNPWGEYGNEEHVQVYRVLKEIQKDEKYDLWFSNYCSNRSLALMLADEHALVSEHVTLDTNISLTAEIKHLYQKNSCWTWYDKWAWLERETFILDRDCDDYTESAGTMIPINLIQVGELSPPQKKKGLIESCVNRLHRYGRRLLK